jgi:hypothetical protein
MQAVGDRVERNQDHHSRLAPAKPRMIASKGAGGCEIFSQDRQQHKTARLRLPPGTAPFPGIQPFQTNASVNNKARLGPKRLVHH